MAHCEEVIVTTESKGNGVELEPFRMVVQIFSKDGNLIAENDPEPTYNKAQMLDFAKWAMHSGKCSSTPDLVDLKKWSESK